MDVTLTRAEEQLMEFLWQKQSLYMKELLQLYPDPKPAATTIATLLKRMHQKHFIGYELMGNSRRYFPVIKKEAYFSCQLDAMVEQFFDNSAFKFASFFTRKGGLSDRELKELQRLIAEQIKDNHKNSNHV